MERGNAALTGEQERQAIDAVTSLDPTPIMSPLPARAIAERLSLSEQQGQAILIDLRDRGLIESRFEHPGSNLDETGAVVVNHYSKWFRVEF